MRLITWNCQGAYRKKAPAILSYIPDIVVVQECEHPEKLILNDSVQRPKDFLWTGDNRNKGLGVFSYSNYKFKLLEIHSPKIKYVLPILVTGGQIDFVLLAIWANNRGDSDGQYITQVWKAINEYDQILNRGTLMLVGDFNSNKIWDKPRRPVNHTTVVSSLAEKNIHSVYHTFSNEEQGKERQPTFFLQRNKLKSYHIDYCFVSGDIYEKINDFKIGNYEDWIAHSDHTPIFIDFNF